MGVSYDTAPKSTSGSPDPPRRLSPRATFIVGLLLVTGLSLVYLNQTSDLAATSYDVAALQDEKTVWEMRNEQLRLQIAELQSLDRVDQSASTRLGMGPPSHVVYVNAPPQPVMVPTPTEAPAPTSAPISTSSIRELLGRLESVAGFQRGQ